jgi:hypothetical protein
MVKRAVVVLGMFSLMIMAAGTCFAFFGMGGCGDDCGGPLYVPVDCPPVPGYKTIVKTWEAKIEGPCPAPVGCAPACKPWDVKGGFFCSLVNAIASPLDIIFGGCDGVYGCFNLGGLGLNRGPCGPGYGPIPGVLAAVPMFLGAPTTMFETLW